MRSGQTVDQSRTYGRAFASIYDAVFPAVGGEPAADFLVSLTSTPSPDFLELGVGSGRVAVPLAARGGTVLGVDSSPEMLDLAVRRAEAAGVDLRLELGDIRTWAPTRRSDIVYCVCATISMLSTRDEQVQALTHAAAGLRVGGSLVVETHDPAALAGLHAGARRKTFEYVVAGLEGGLRSESLLSSDSSVWQVEHQWVQDGHTVTAHEHSLLTTPQHLEQLADRAGLRPVATFSGWGTQPSAPDDPCPTYVSVFAHRG